VAARWCTITADGSDSEVVIEDDWSNQTRTITISQTHKNKFVEYFKEFGWNDFPPIPASYDYITGRYIAKGGHHRLQAAMEAGLKEVPVFVLEFGELPDPGLDAEEEFKQADNGRHKETLRHDEDDALKYLKKLGNDGYFKAAESILDVDDRKKKVRELAHGQLAKHYSSYSKRKRGGIITTYLNGTLPSLIKTWRAKDADAWFTGNGHLSNLGAYVNNQIDITTQAHTAVSYPIGQIYEIIRDAFESLREDDVSEDRLEKKAKALKVRVGIYDNTATSWKALKESREKVLARATRMRLDLIFVTPFAYDEIKFIYQSIAAPNQESECPIVYKWSALNKEYIKQP
jgi:hypothetical protein